MLTINKHGRRDSSVEAKDFAVSSRQLDELPFEFLSKEYPSLLNEWYPGYPGVPRYMTEEDPMLVDGRVEDTFLVIPDMPNLDKIPLPPDVKEFGDGECKAWIRKDSDSWVVLLQK